MFRRVATSLLFLTIIALTAVGVIAWSRGIRVNISEKTLTSTGILSASSYPDKASIFVNGKLESATGANLTLSPGWYTVRIAKEGYQAWEKKIQIAPEVVSQIDALLIPQNPSLKAFSVTGVLNPVLSPDGVKVAYIVPAEPSTPSSSLQSKVGIWVQELRYNPLGIKIEPRALYLPSIDLDWANTALSWSPDGKKVLADVYRKTDGKTVSISQTLQIDAETPATPVVDATAIRSRILTEWDTQQKELTDLKLTSFPIKISSVLSTAAGNLRISPDDSKILYESTASATLPRIIVPEIIGSNPVPEIRELVKGSIYVYDKKEDRNYRISDLPAEFSGGRMIWYTDSKNIIMIQKDKINIMDYDGGNMRVVYAGPFQDAIVYPWPGGNRLIILTNLNNPSALPNFYEVDLR